MTEDRSVTSILIGTARPSMRSISRASAIRASMRRAATATLAPARASTRAKCRPKPPDAPVTRAARPERSKSPVIGRSGHEPGKAVLDQLNDLVGAPRDMVGEPDRAGLGITRHQSFEDMQMLLDARAAIRILLHV